MNNPQKIDVFDAALTAFEIRFESELSSRWQDLEYKLWDQSAHGSADEKRSAVLEFFDGIRHELKEVVHQYFPKLLGVAALYRNRLGLQSPLEWSVKTILSQAYGFLHIEEEFNEGLPPQDQSRKRNL